MDSTSRIEQALEAALAHAEHPEGPPLLAKAMRHAVFPGGARVRPRLCLAVAAACGGGDALLSGAAAAAIELLHCASLAHDDLPCFDDSKTRRGRASVHAAFGEPIALLAGDALIVLAFETLARGAARKPALLAEMIGVVGRAVGSPYGICAGQAWESETVVDLGVYHRAKTGALFAAAAAAGALAAGERPDAWRRVGERIGEAYQVADDIQDVVADPDAIGKPCGRDDALGRPSATRELGIDRALDRFNGLVGFAVDSIPDCPGRADLSALIKITAQHILPKELWRRAA
jgi:geranylgeranyl diphosphate synthase type II